MGEDRDEPLNFDADRALPAGYSLAGYRSGAIGAIAGMHGRYYGRHWDLGLYFEAKVATDLSAFLLRLDPERDRLWTLWRAETFIGSIAIDGSEDDSNGEAGRGDGGQAHLRWFIIDPACQGQGLGRALLLGAIAFCRKASFGSVYLWTFAGLDGARALYESVGFQLEAELENRQWGKPLREQRFRLVL